MSSSSAKGRWWRAPRRGAAAGQQLGLALLLALLCAAQGSCGPARRHLQQAAAAPAPPVPAATNSTNSTGPTIETVEVDVVSQECVILQNAYYNVDASIGVMEVMGSETNLQDSARDCCASCHDVSTCNAFQWCPEVAGCFLGSVYFPYRGCQLIDLSGFLNTSVNTGQIKQEGPNVPFISGSPLFFSVPKLTGYDVEVGRNFGGRFNYSCPGSNANDSCVIEGSAQVLGAACNADPLCLAFSFYPKGSPMFPDSPYGVLKGGENVALSSANTELNPNAAIYIKLQPVSTTGSGSGGGGSSNKTVVIVAVVAAVVGTAVVATGVLAFVYMRYRRLKASVADDRKPARLAEEGDVDAQGDPDDELGSGASGPVPDLSSAGGASPVVASGQVGGGSAAGSFRSGDGDSSSRLEAAAAAVAVYSSGGGSRTAAAQAAAAGPYSINLSSGWGAASGAPNVPSPFVLYTPHIVAPGAGAGATPDASAVHASRTSSGGSGTQAAAAMWQVQQQQQSGMPQQAPADELAQIFEVQLVQHSQQQHSQHSQQQQQHNWQQHQQYMQQLHSGSDALPVVVEVQRAMQPASGGRSELPPSLQQAGTARELLEVFARMYSQRPAVDYAVVAEMLDQDADPKAVSAAESADEEQLRRVDAAAAAARVTSRAASAPNSGSSSSAQLADALQQQFQQHFPQQQAGGGVGAGAPPGGALQGPAARPGSAQLDQEQSLLPGMTSPDSSMFLPNVNWTLQPEEVEIVKRPDGTYWQLGTGAFGTCYKGLYHGSQLVAVKVLHRVEERRRGEEFEREVSLLKTLQNRNIVQFIGACLDGPAPMLVTEFLEFGDLWRGLPLKNPADQRIFAWHKRGRRVLFDVAKGLHYLHQRRIVHLDLKSANILLSRHGTAKICDIGMARVLGNKEYLSMLSGMGTFAWSAPEVLSGKRCTEKVDLYSFGVVIWEVCTGDVPVRGEMRPLTAPQDCPQEVVDLYERCISEHPEARPTAAELLTILASLL